MCTLFFGSDLSTIIFDVVVVAGGTADVTFAVDDDGCDDLGSVSH